MNPADDRWTKEARDGYDIEYMAVERLSDPIATFEFNYRSQGF